MGGRLKGDQGNKMEMVKRRMEDWKMGGWRMGNGEWEMEDHSSFAGGRKWRRCAV